MNLYKDFFVGLFTCVRAISWLKNKKILILFVISIFLSFIAIGPFIIFDQLFSKFLSSIPYLNTGKYVSQGFRAIANFMGFLLLIVLSPVFTLVSDEVSKQKSGKSYRFSIPQLIKDVIRAVKVTFRALLMQFVFTTLLSIIASFLPTYFLIGLFIKILNFLIVSFFFGTALLDYTFENFRFSFNETIQFNKKHIGLPIGIGVIYFITIYLNNFDVVKEILGALGLYWSILIQGIASFLGVIAGSLVLNEKLGSR